MGLICRTIMRLCFNISDISLWPGVMKWTPLLNTAILMPCWDFKNKEFIMDITTIGIDLAKNVFQLHGANIHGKKVFGKRVSREKFAETVHQLPQSLIGIEACGSAHYWARRFTKMGHTVKLMSPQYVKNQ